MANAAIRTSVKGVPEAQAALAKFDKRIRTKVLRQAVTKATKLVTKAARRLAPRDTGSLQKAIGERVRTYRDSGMVVGIAGARSKLRFRVIEARRRKQAKRVKRGEPTDGTRRPVRYLHLVVRGTKRAKANDFITAAGSQTEAQVKDTLETEIVAGVQRETAAMWREIAGR